MVKWSEAASRDLQSIFEYIARDSPHYARYVVDALLGKSDDIEPFAERGRVVPELGDPNVRELFVYSYRLVYERSEDAIIVLAVMHGRRERPPIPRSGA